ncbi:Autophagy protein 16 (ATG16) [Musa troglodytarum]|uniref:Autophagy protein 16 (ATG16) n=1 Tax=Musa troglodytarum TaxID=320322 RepID=A0A9E7HX11_9LILI|nr:Autophagy protein 16 (ATG16) [Musa troglodytarum]
MEKSRRSLDCFEKSRKNIDQLDRGRKIKPVVIKKQLCLHFLPINRRFGRRTGRGTSIDSMPPDPLICSSSEEIGTAAIKRAIRALRKRHLLEEGAHAPAINALSRPLVAQTDNKDLIDRWMLEKMDSAEKLNEVNAM